MAPRPQPTRLRILRGNPSRRPVNGNEPKTEAKIPRCPAALDAEGKKAWKRLTKQLHRMGLIGECDADALALYCAEWSRWTDAQAKLRAFGPVMVLENKGGAKYPALSPYLRIAQAATARMQSLLAEFGLTPSSRSRLQVPAASAERDEFEKFLNEVS